MLPAMLTSYYTDKHIMHMRMHKGENVKTFIITKSL